jgi:hypothetical protein
MGPFDPNIYLKKKPEPEVVIPDVGFEFEPDPELQPVVIKEVAWEDEEVIPEYIEIRVKSTTVLFVCCCLGLGAFAVAYLWIEQWLK